jgi:hypothetical protein
MGSLHYLSLRVALCRQRQATTDRIASNFVSDVQQQNFNCSRKQTFKLHQYIVGFLKTYFMIAYESKK